MYHYIIGARIHSATSCLWVAVCVVYREDGIISNPMPLFVKVLIFIKGKAVPVYRFLFSMKWAGAITPFFPPFMYQEMT